jgi:hypothetical protein
LWNRRRNYECWRWVSFPYKQSDLEEQIAAGDRPSDRVTEVDHQVNTNRPNAVEADADRSAMPKPEGETGTPGA